MAALLVAPFLAGLGQAGLADWHGVDVPGLARAGFVSVTSATLATALVALGGIPLGYVLARTSGRAMALLGFVVQLPLALPPLASGVLLLFLLGYSAKHAPILYPAALTPAAKPHADEALAYLHAPEALRLFESFGYRSA